MRKNYILALSLAVAVANAQTKKDTRKDSLKVSEINEVVLTSSYGTKKLKEELTGSISTISAKDIQVSQSYESIDKMISGLSPGVQIVNSTELAAPVQINIRGLGSMTPLSSTRFGTSTQPLIIIDGVIMKEDRAFDATGFNGNSASETLINPLARLSTDNIESVNILKDATAVALYGADAANGIILITTKKGRKGTPRFSISSQYGISQSINKMKYLSGEQYAKVYDAYLRNNGSTSGYSWNGVDVNWFDVMNGNGDYFKTNFGVSGGGSHINYRFGADYSENHESKIFNSLNKKGLDATIGADFGKFKASLYAAYNEMEKNDPNQYFNFILAPTFAVYNDDGIYRKTGYKGIPNPLAAATQNISNLKNKSLLSSLNAGYDITKNLKFSTIFGIDYSKKNETDWNSGLNESGQGNGTFVVNGITFPKYGESKLGVSDAVKWNWSAQLFFDKNFAKNHHIDALAGFELRKTKDNKTSETGSNFTNPYEYQLPSAAASYLNSGKNVRSYFLRTLHNEDAGRSAFLQANYDFKKKYFFTGTIRRDESSAFGADKNAAWNGGAGLAWVLSKENFMKNSGLDFLRLRASYGITGNSRIGSYRSSGLYNVYHNGYLFGGDYAYPDTSSPPNSRLGWEKNQKLNLGLDINLSPRYRFTAEIFKNNLSDMIVSRDTPPETGYSSAEINGAAMYNKGFEISAEAYWFVRKDFRWTTKFNISKVVNKVTGLIGFGDDFSNASVARAQKIGAPTSAFWGYHWVGIDPSTGMDIYNVNGQNITADKLDNTAANSQIIGNSQPDFTGGMLNTIIYKNFSLSFLVNFQIGGDEMVIPELIDNYRILLNRNMSINALDYWSLQNPDAQIHLPSKNTKLVSNNSKYIFDETNIKLQDVNVSYSIPFGERKAFIKNASIFLDATNVLYWYKEKSPEGRNGIREFRYLYPEMRTFSMGFRVNF